MGVSTYLDVVAGGMAQERVAQMQYENRVLRDMLRLYRSALGDVIHTKTDDPEVLRAIARTAFCWEEK